MNRTILALAFASLSALLAVPANAGFDVAYAEGSRNDVRAWCATDGGVLSDREDYTMCVSANASGVTFTCDDAGACTRTGFDLIETGSILVPGQSVRQLPETAPQAGQRIVPSPLYPVPYRARTNFD